jgi:hypothetical protein
LKERKERSTYRTGMELLHHPLRLNLRYPNRLSSPSPTTSSIILQPHQILYSYTHSSIQPQPQHASTKSISMRQIS